MAEISPRFLLVYGSQTGQSKAVAEEVFERSAKMGLNADINCLSSFGEKFAFESESVAVIVISSTGDGEPPDTARKFYRAIHSKTLSTTHLSSLKYALLGLGDSNYTSCWNCPKTVDKRLKELGATPFYPSGYADDATGLEVIVEPWVEGLFVALKSLLESPGSAVPAVGLLAGGMLQPQPKTGDDCPPASSAAPELVHPPALSVTAALQQLQLDQESSTDVGRAVDEPPEDQALSKLEGAAATAAASPTADATAAEVSSLDPARGDAAAISPDAGKEAMRIRSLRLSAGAALSLPTKPERFLCLSALDCLSGVADDDVRRCKAKAGNPEACSAAVLRADVLTGPAALKKTLLLQLSLEGTGLSYEPGDAFGLHCENDAREVRWLLERLEVPTDKAEHPVSIDVMPQCSRKLARVPEHLMASSASLRQLFTYCMEIRALPKKAFICLAAEYASDELEQRRLLELSSREGSQDYADIVMAGRISFLDLLAFFPSCQPPVEVVLENLPPLQPRSYSAASSQLKQSSTVDIVFNIMHLRSFEGRLQTGLCTGWLDQLTSELQAKKVTPCFLPEVYLLPRKARHFRLPVSAELPVLMVCAGTGIAPFVGFLEHRYQQKIANPNAALGQLWLFYGCRHADKDFLFRNKLEDMLRHGVLAKCVVCFSQQKPVVDNELATFSATSPDSDLATALQPSGLRSRLADSADLASAANVSPDSDRKHMPTIADSSVGSPLAMQQRQSATGLCDSATQSAAPTDCMLMLHGYVQDALATDSRAVGEAVWTRGAHIYVCGSTAMAKGVLAAMTTVTSSAREVTSSEASAMIKELKLSKRYLEDVWS